MPTPPISEVAEVEQHYLAQFAIVAGLTKAADELWPILDPADLASTFPIVQRGLAALVDHFSQASISVAADYYEDLRALHVSGRFSVPVVDSPPAAEVAAVFEAVASPRLEQASAVRDDLFLAQITSQLVRGAQIAAQSLVADSGSDEIFTAMSRDDEAQGWARITRPGACYFCRMLATRGAVYLTRRSGSFRAHSPRNGRGGCCSCTVEPQFTRTYEPTAQARQDIETWARVARGHPEAEAIDRFRRAVEGRSDGPKRRRQGRKSKAAEPSSVSFETLTPAQLRHQISVLESLKDSDWRIGQSERVRNRLADLGN